MPLGENDNRRPTRTPGPVPRRQSQWNFGGSLDHRKGHTKTDTAGRPMTAPTRSIPHWHRGDAGRRLRPALVQ